MDNISMVQSQKKMQSEVDGYEKMKKEEWRE